MSKLKDGLTLLGQIARHPRNRKWPVPGLLSFFAWQAWKRIVGKPCIVKVGSNRKFLAAPDSSFSSQVIYTGLPEWDEMNFFLRYLRPEDRFLDLGANVGFYTVLASTIIDRGEIVSVEASPRNTEILRRQVEINALSNVRVIPTAVGRENGTVRFAAAQREMGSIVENGERAPDTIEVPCQKLDTVLAGLLESGERVDLAKMDVEGCEMLILEGATEILRRGLVRAWLFEVSDGALKKHGHSAQVLLDTFLQSGYSLGYWDETARELHSLNNDIDLDHSNLIACLDSVHMKQRLGLSNAA